MENKKASVEIGVNLSSSLMNASLTMLTIITALFVFIIEKRETSAFFYILFSLSFISFIISIYHSGKGIDKARKAIYHDNFKQNKTKKYYNYQAIFCFLGIFFSITSIFFTKQDKSEQIKFDKLNSNLEVLIEQHNKNLIQNNIYKEENIQLNQKILTLENKIIKIEERLKNEKR